MLRRFRPQKPDHSQAACIPVGPWLRSSRDFCCLRVQTVDVTISDQTEQEPNLDQLEVTIDVVNLGEQKLQLALATAERKLAEARLQIAELEALLDEIPEIFERKFEQRLQPVLERQERLLEDNAELRQQIQHLAPGPGELRLRFNAQAGKPNHGLSLPQLPSRQTIRPMGRMDRRDQNAA